MASCKVDNPHSAKIITIDGPAGAGKSTVAKAVAKELGFMYLDTGAMYRAITLKALRQKIDLQDDSKLVELAKGTSIDIAMGEGDSIQVLLDGEDVTKLIRSQEVTNSTFYIARIPGVRKVMVQRQREIGSKKNVVVEGRDLGTVVFPDATKKFYLDADFDERAQRRIKELKEKNVCIDENKIASEIKKRDTKDITRQAGPLKKADDATVIDSTHLSIEEVVNKILGYIGGNG